MQGGPELIDSLYYSANVYAARAISKIEALPPTSPLYIHLTWQNVHGPCERHVSISGFCPCCCANANALLVLPADEAPPVRRKARSAATPFPLAEGAGTVLAGLGERAEGHTVLLQLLQPVLQAAGARADG